MSENIYNIFIFYENERCSIVGYTIHEYSGDDEQCYEYLKQRIPADFLSYKKHTLKKSFTRSEYNARCRLGEGYMLYDELFSKLNAGASPLFMATPVKNGEIFFNYSSTHDRLDMDDVSKKLGAKGVMIDWLIKYTNDGKLDIPQLINDDYFLAIKLTLNAGLYVSSMKLLLSCIDSLAYIEHGDNGNVFTKWLNSYANLSPLQITAEELWELRNGLLHMTNINSKKVRTKNTRRISFKVGGNQYQIQNASEDSIYYFDFYNLFKIVTKAIAQWIDTYNNDHDKFTKFVERYDETISDSRLAISET